MYVCMYDLIKYKGINFDFRTLVHCESYPTNTYCLFGSASPFFPTPAKASLSNPCIVANVPSIVDNNMVVPAQGGTCRNDFPNTE